MTWRTKPQIMTDFDLDAEDAERVNWRQLKRRIGGLHLADPGWEYEVASIEEIMAAAVGDKLLKKGSLDIEIEGYQEPDDDA